MIHPAQCLGSQIILVFTVQFQSGSSLCFSFVANQLRGAQAALTLFQSPAQTEWPSSPPNATSNFFSFSSGLFSITLCGYTLFNYHQSSTACRWCRRLYFSKLATNKIPNQPTNDTHRTNIYDHQPHQHVQNIHKFHNPHRRHHCILPYPSILVSRKLPNRTFDHKHHTNIFDPQHHLHVRYTRKRDILLRWASLLESTTYYRSLLNENGSSFVSYFPFP